MQEQLSNLTALVQENLSGARVVRAYAQEGHELARFEEANREFLPAQPAPDPHVRQPVSRHPAPDGLGRGPRACGWAGAWWWAARITLGEFVAFGTYLTMLHWPMIALGWVVNIYERGEASMGRILDILHAEPEIRDRDPLPVSALRGEVEFRGLTFAYDGAPVLHDVDLHVPAGTTVAIVGPTGSGKSTLVSLIPRLFEAPAGHRASWTATTCARLPLSVLRGAVGFVPQESFLFSDTVGDNVAFGLPADAADRMARVHAAAGIAQLEQGRGATSRAASTPSWASAASRSPAARSSARPWPARWPPTRGSSSSTTRSARWTPTPRRRSCAGCAR